MRQMTHAPRLPWDVRFYTACEGKTNPIMVVRIQLRSFRTDWGRFLPPFFCEPRLNF